MIIYKDSVANFHNDVFKGVIANKLEELFVKFNIGKESQGEYRSWNNSLEVVSSALKYSNVNEDLKVAIEYQIPLTSKRVDFLLRGYDDSNKENVVIVELKQWEECQATSRDDVVTTFVGGAVRAVSHPCYQAYSYAKAIESFNETVRDKDIILHPCAFCHNYKDEYIDKKGMHYHYIHDYYQN